MTPTLITTIARQTKIPREVVAGMMRPEEALRRHSGGERHEKIPIVTTAIGVLALPEQKLSRRMRDWAPHTVGVSEGRSN